MKKQFLIAMVVATVFTTLLIVGWGYYKMNSIKENKEKTHKLASNIKSLFQNNNSLDDYPFKPTTINWQKKYLVLESIYTDQIGVTYNNEWNKQLQTENNYPGNNINGLVIVEFYSIDIGKYENSIQKATQQNYIVNYFDIKNKIIVAKDTIFGEDPPSRIQGTQSGSGNLPSDEKLFETITKRTK